MPRPWITAILVIVLADQTASAQTPAALIRRSTLPTPNVQSADIVRQQRLDIPSGARLIDPRESAVLTLDLFADVSFRAVRERLEPTAHGMSWIGTLDGYPDSTAIFVLVGDELIGHINAPFGFFRISRQRDGAYLVQQIDAADPDGPDAVPPVDERAAVASADAGMASAVEEADVIDVMFAYTDEALTGFGSVAAVQARVDLMLAEANESLQNTGLTTRVRLVHLTRVDYAESGDSLLDIARLERPKDGFMDDLHPLRNTYAADVVGLITERMDGTTAGRANLGTLSKTAENGGFLSVRRTAGDMGHVFAHELGHVLGTQHDWFDPHNPNTFSYSHGYVSIAGRFQDVMAAHKHCVAVLKVRCTMLVAYANPRLTHHGRPVGVPEGTNVTCTEGNVNNPDCDADAARSIAIIAPRVARYRHSLTALRARQLLPGASFRSTSGRYRLTYQVDGNLVLSDDRDQVPLWSTNTGGTTPGQALLQTDGNFIVSDGSGAVLWASETSGNTNAYLVVQDDGNLVIVGADGLPLWSRLQ